MRIQFVRVGLALTLLAAGCEPPPRPAAAPTGPPPPPAPVAATPAPAPVEPQPVAKAEPPALPPELVAKVEEVLKLAKQPAPTAADPLDQAVVAAEQQLKVVALAAEIPPLVEKLTPEQKAEFERRFGEQFKALLKPPAPAAPPPNP